VKGREKETTINEKKAVHLDSREKANKKGALDIKGEKAIGNGGKLRVTTSL